MKKLFILLTFCLLSSGYISDTKAFSLGDAVKIGTDVLNKKKQDEEKQRREADQRHQAELSEARQYTDRILQDYKMIKDYPDIRLGNDIQQMHSDLEYSYSANVAQDIRQKAKSLSDMLPPYQAQIKDIEKRKTAERQEEQRTQEQAQKERQRQQNIEREKLRAAQAVKKKQTEQAHKQKQQEETERKKQSETQRFANLSDTDKLGEEILNYTSFGDKAAHAESWKMIDPANCVFRRTSRGVNMDVKLNNVLLDVLKIGRTYSRYYKKLCHVVKLSGDQPVTEIIYEGQKDKKLSYDFENESCTTDNDRLKKAWGLLFTKVCKGSKSSAF